MSKKSLVFISLFSLVLLAGCGSQQDNSVIVSQNSNTNAWYVRVGNGDEIQVSYTFSFDNWDVYEQWETSFVVWVTQLPLLGEISLLDASAWQELVGELTPEQTKLADGYDVSKKQSLAKIYFDEMWIVPEVWLNVYFNGIWTGEIIEMMTADDANYYMIDFNAPETYKNLKYVVKVLEIVKSDAVN